VRWNEFDFCEESGLFVHESFLSGEWGVPKWELFGYTPGRFLKSVKQKELEDTELGRRYGKWKARQKAEGRE
jgi:hypothetical protein